MAKKKGFYATCEEEPRCRMIGCHERAMDGSLYCEEHDKEMMEMPSNK